ncbi:glycine zipper domain-containing protein [Vibrio sp. BS-M-Sm-2]|uniref:glycine zipper domain-containing protein n=1 Tax=unclassified Vibrio TaxID=2614977 RepID=UPI00255B7D44|nr:glycine zipper domain-containing protein [Vibrio sp. TMPB1044]MDL5026366.1 glycine zipper domain-containing protein [Vibrio sp. TMPB1044]MDN5206494.1 glycine zipper domain-containing protein [Vibrio sp. TMPB1044]
MSLLNNKLKAMLISVALFITGCSSPALDTENENAARNRGAVGGALVGATLGALTGDAKLAAQGAAIGGVTGGVAGSMKDLDDSRQSENNQVLADGMSQDNRSDAEKRVAELEAEIRIRELEKQLADTQEQDKQTTDQDS